MRRTILCVARAEVFGTGHALERVQGISFVSHGVVADGIAPLRTRAGDRDLFLGVDERYTVARLAPVPQRTLYEIRLVYYSYAILDRDERELLVYHWHPDGVSNITFPHLHIARVAPLPLERTDPPRAVALGEMHLPTNRVLLEDVVELLIREFAVAPLREDWRAVLTANRAASQAG